MNTPAAAARGTASGTAPAAAYAYVALVAALLVGFPYIASSYQTILLSYGLVMAIAALAVNLLLGYTGLLSFGHSVYFGAAAYGAAFVVKYLHVVSMEAFLAGGLLSGLVIAAVFGFICVRYTKIFFSILTLALSQVGWSLALKLFWVTGGTDGIRVPTPLLLGGIFGTPSDKVVFLAHRRAGGLIGRRPVQGHVGGHDAETGPAQPGAQDRRRPPIPAIGRRVVQLFARPGVADRARRFDQRPHPAAQVAVVDRVAAIVERGRQVCAAVDVQAHAHP